MNTAHDIYACDCHETCSWCTTSVFEPTLRVAPDGARICARCQREAKLKGATA